MALTKFLMGFEGPRILDNTRFFESSLPPHEILILSQHVYLYINS